MDYKTKATSRNELRVLSKVLRLLFDVPETGAFPVLHILERVSDIFKGCNYAVVESKRLPFKTMARCVPNENNGFTIEIKDFVYKGTYERSIGAYLGFICHEICHVFLFKIGFTPTFERSFGDKELRAFESVEWQAKALCGEVMIPYDESKSMTIKEIMKTYHVSNGCAQFRHNMR